MDPLNILAKFETSSSSRSSDKGRGWEDPVDLLRPEKFPSYATGYSQAHSGLNLPKSRVSEKVIKQLGGWLST